VQRELDGESKFCLPVAVAGGADASVGPHLVPHVSIVKEKFFARINISERKYFKNELSGLDRIPKLIYL
jgi:hypothetical protein